MNLYLWRRRHGKIPERFWTDRQTVQIMLVRLFRRCGGGCSFQAGMRMKDRTRQEAWRRMNDRTWLYTLLLAGMEMLRWRNSRPRRTGLPSGQVGGPDRISQQPDHLQVRRGHDQAGL